MKKEPTASLLTAAFLVVGHGCIQCLCSEATGGSGSGGLPGVGFVLLAARLLCHGFSRQVTGDVAAEAWEDSECSRGTNTMAMSGRVDFPKTSLLTSDSGLHGLTQVVREDFPKVPCSSAGAVTGSGAQVAPALVVGGQERTS